MNSSWNWIKYGPFYLFSIIPLNLLFILSDISFIFLYHIFRYRRKVVINNLTNAFPTYDSKQIKKIEKDFYKHFCDIFFESGKFLTISEKEIKRRFKVVNPELTEPYYEQKRSMILYTAHMGNWEWLACFPLYIKHQSTTFYQPLSNKFFNTLIVTARQRFGVIAIESNKGYKALVNFAKKGMLTFSCMIGDQSPSKENAQWVRFLEQDTAFLVGADRIAKKMDQVVMFSLITKPRRGHYELELILLHDDMKNVESFEIMNSYAANLEKAIRRSPHLWLWSHNRWKLKRQTVEV